MAYTLEPFYKKHEFKFDGKMAYGMYKNRMTTFIESSSTIKATISFGIPLTKEEAYQISIKLKELKQQFRPLLQGLVSNINLELTLYQGSDVLENIEKILDETAIVINNNTTNSDYGICPLCGKPVSTDSPFMRIRNSVIQAHNECLDNLEAESKRFRDSSAKKGKKTMVKSILMSIGIAIAVVLLNILIGFSNMFPFAVSLSGWFCLFLISVAFKRIKMPLNRESLMILIFTSVSCLLLSIYFGSIAYIYISLINKPDSIMFVFENYFKILLNDENIQLVKYLGFSSLCGVVMLIIPYIGFYRRIGGSLENTMKRL